MEFQTFDPQATVRGANIKATLQALAETAAIAAETPTSKLRQLSEHKSVPVQSWLDALRDIQAHVGEPALRATGVRLVENAEFPPIYPTVEAVLLGLNEIYYANHEGNVGRYHVEQRGDGAVVVHCETPYPRQFERGLIEGICRNRRRGDAVYYVEYRDGVPGTDVTCTLTVYRA